MTYLSHSILQYLEMIQVEGTPSGVGNQKIKFRINQQLESLINHQRTMHSSTYSLFGSGQGPVLRLRTRVNRKAWVVKDVPTRAPFPIHF